MILERELTNSSKDLWRIILFLSLSLSLSLARVQQTCIALLSRSSSSSEDLQRHTYISYEEALVRLICLILVQPLIYGWGPSPSGMEMMPMLLPDGRIGYVLQQPGGQPLTPPPQQRSGRSGSRGGGPSGGRRGNDSGRGRSRENGSRPKPCPPRPGEKGEMHVVPVQLPLISALSKISLSIPSDLRPVEARQSILFAIQELEKRFPQGLPKLNPVKLGMAIKSDLSLLRSVPAPLVVDFFHFISPGLMALSGFTCLAPVAKTPAVFFSFEEHSVPDAGAVADVASGELAASAAATTAGELPATAASVEDAASTIPTKCSNAPPV
ncbi:DExH-box ATP-dependent RNA helicase DExH10 [Camellia lanceoleosa]|uniref:DExH-box ATP-dependent RNA helicase DExH10 n=1 Tax=Camellia lanceoleosa TaxID=1840588 RepID=A0ACC0FQN1_9ERIC|nr:DExH-box ATP-dependent RNA helicase DExH10 [Camellia lanceoleosa]